MKAGYNQKRINNNINQNNQLLSNSGKKKMLKNIDINQDYSDEDENNNENNKKEINQKFEINKSNSNVNNVTDNRIKRFNLDRRNLEKPDIHRPNMKKNSFSNINFNREYSDQLNNKFVTNNLNSNFKRSLSGEKNYKPLNNLYNLTEEKKYNSINRITTSYSSKYNQTNRNIQNNYIQGNFAPTNNNTKVIKIQKNNLNEVNTNLYPTFNDDKINNNFNRTFNNNYNNRIANNNFYPNQTQNFNSNNMNNINQLGNNFNLAQPLLSINNKTPNYDFQRGNNTIGYLTYKKQNQMNNFNNNNFQGYKTDTQPRLINPNQPPYIMPSADDDEDDGRFHELSITKNFSRLKKPSPFSNPIGFDPAFKQQQINQNNIRDNNQLGRNTFIKKLPPLNEENNKINMVNNNMMNNNPFQRGISASALNNQIKTSNLNNMMNIGDNNDPNRSNNPFGNNINIKKIPTEINNNMNNNILLPRANAPINNIVPNAASFNPKIQNVSEINISNNKNEDANNILPARNININILPNRQTPIENNLQQMNYKINNQIIPQREPENLEQNIQNDIDDKNFKQDEEKEENIEQNEENIEQNEEENEQNEQNEENNKEQNEEPNPEQNPEQNEENDESQEKKDPNISYNEFDFSGLLKNYGGLSSPGIDSNGNQKTNQDTLVFRTNINKIKDFNIFGVLDGHGTEGHHVSQFSSEYILSQIINHPEIKELTDPELIYQKLKENNCQIITEAFLSCDEQLKNAEFDAYNSGSTCNLIIHIGQHILCANVGDSRAIVAYDDHPEDEELNYLEEAQLSIDYKPEMEEEKNRIILSGGVVEQMKNQFGEKTGPFRVWVKDQDYPGLAMSRSIGDLKSKTIGVISEPGILEYDVNESTKFIVIASDGVWEFMENAIIKEMAKKHYLQNETSPLCHEIVNTSVSLWEKRDVVVDDITVVVMFF